MSAGRAMRLGTGLIVAPPSRAMKQHLCTDPQQIQAAQKLNGHHHATTCVYQLRRAKKAAGGVQCVTRCGTEPREETGQSAPTQGALHDYQEVGAGTCETKK